MRKAYKDFHEFWTFYVREHSKQGTRILHFIGTTALLVLLSAGILNSSASTLLAGVVAAYASAWTGHFVFERNLPATFRYPLFSLLADFKMYGLMLTGRMEKELQKIKLGAI
jgi:hypothetical protein